MRQTAEDRHGWRLPALIVVLWRGGLRVHEALALTERDLDKRRGSLLIPHPCRTTAGRSPTRSSDRACLRLCLRASVKARPTDLLLVRSGRVERGDVRSCLSARSESVRSIPCHAKWRRLEPVALGASLARRARSLRAPHGQGWR